MANLILLSTGEKACVKCWKRPVMMRRARTRTGAGRRWVPGSYCRVCANRYNRDRREGMIQALVTPEQRELLRGIVRAQALGAEILVTAAPAGKHHAAAAL